MYLGLLFALATFIFLALRNVNVFLIALICILIVIVTNGMPLEDALLNHFPFGKLGAFSFAGKFFLLFTSGAMFGRVMGESGAASSIALALVRKLGAHNALWITVLFCSFLTYGGVVVFVVVFTMYPLGLRLLREANIPKRLFTAALLLGSATYTMTALPGTPSIHNVISSSALGTSLFAGSLYGLTGAAIMFTLGMIYLERQRKAARVTGEGFTPVKADERVMNSVADQGLPDWRLSVIPLLTVILVIMLPRLLYISGMAGAGNGAVDRLVLYANGQPVLWPSIALCAGILLSILLFSSLWRRAMKVIGAGAQDAIIPLMATSIVIGFGGVVTQTDSFTRFVAWVGTVDLSPLLSLFVSANLVSGIVGSASGGLQIFMETMAQGYLDKGMAPETLHRIATMAAGCFDSLPHSGAVIATLAITNQSHREAYKDMAVISILIPVIATLATILLASLTGAIF